MAEEIRTLLGFRFLGTFPEAVWKIRTIQDDGSEAITYHDPYGPGRPDPSIEPAGYDRAEDVGYWKPTGPDSYVFCFNKR